MNQKKQQTKQTCVYHWEKYDKFIDEHGTIYVKSDVLGYDYKFKAKDTDEWDYATKQQLFDWRISARPYYQ